MSAAAIEVRGVTVRYHDVLALDGADLTVPAGRLTGLLGMNGSGKSSLLKAIMGIVTPDAGEVRVLGRASREARREALIGYVPQSEDVDWSFPLTVRDVVAQGRYGRLGPLRRPRAVDRAAVEEALDRVGLGELADRQIGRLSGGQRKRAFLARCLAQEARVLLLDEPFAGVDVSSQAAITGLLRELVADGVGALVSTHDLAALPTLADDAVLLHRRVLAAGAPHDVLRPENLALAFGGAP
ncbi:metal ABC transporter ATP-binding protein [Cellulomonas chengniuliangii]|uniref:Metal ABC transporter ATP-binding protein n=1 Tax=Cellulomonas chengniuliangii TaxID=2968084 RepID=A0ABY5L4M4_9CELL|nr:metal ABC transporter ATP-binding protein [Cellulomonas chengniuliangii]MCC2308001.1 metal ABC transporter ATP-binding protein [Cellulomonas chengniuliangii]MCC2318223.1 metal ABC transporter ATP-binding protein [Cellulomonas chengniuliangii]UUI76405.1 metal ABC transporter ATP-binding protein [Cellulomonas chengniuliangii]